MSDNSPHDIEKDAAATADALRRRLVAAYFSYIARAKLWSLWWVALIALAVIAVGFAVDLRVAIVGFMLLLIVYPLSMTMAVLSSAMRPEVVKSASVASAMLLGGCLRLYDVAGAEIACVMLDKLKAVNESDGLVRIIDRERRLVLVPRAMLGDADLSALYSALPDEL